MKKSIILIAFVYENPYLHMAMPCFEVRWHFHAITTICLCINHSRTNNHIWNKNTL